MRKLEENERMLQVFLSRGLSEKAAQDILDCLDHIEEMRNDSFQSYVHTKEKINGESQNNLWTADTALDKMKNTYFLYKNSIFKEFAMIAYLDSLDSKHKNEHLEQMRHTDKVWQTWKKEIWSRSKGLYAPMKKSNSLSVRIVEKL